MNSVTMCESEGFFYSLTMIDHYSRWREATSIINKEAVTVARASIDSWISRYRCSERISTDQGGEFEAELYQELTKLLGSYRIHTTAYHPKSNGLIERWHQDLKASVTC